MKITKSRLKQIIKEELKSIAEDLPTGAEAEKKYGLEGPAAEIPEVDVNLVSTQLRKAENEVEIIRNHLINASRDTVTTSDTIPQVASTTDPGGHWAHESALHPMIDLLIRLIGFIKDQEMVSRLANLTGADPETKAIKDLTAAAEEAINNMFDAGGRTGGL